MARRKQTKGPCSYCGRVLARTGMARHLQACPARTRHIAEAGDRRSVPEGTFLHLQVQDAHSGDYWLHLEMAGSARLEILDAYLRRIWLECCGHLSEFYRGRGWRAPEIEMSAASGRVFRPGEEVYHVYDFGTSSWTRIREVGERRGPATSDRPLVLMARNEAPDLDCMECDRPAVWLCMDCVYDYRSGMLCERHALEHEHGEYERLPVVNSPRLGLCGYTGPAEPPW